MTRYQRKRGWYRSRRGIIFGVCRGLGEYFDFSVFWVRFMVVVALMITGIWPMAGFYIVAALVMKPEPVRPFESEAERDFYDSYVDSRQRSKRRLRRRYDRLDRRIQRMEGRVTGKDFEWEEKMKRA
jgi:phage shock protein C